MHAKLLLQAVSFASTILYFLSQSISVVGTDEVPGDFSRRNEIMVSDLSPVPRPKGKSAMTGDDYHFQVPKTTLRVTIFPFSPEIYLHGWEVKECVRKMQNTLSVRRETEMITRIIYEKSEGVRLKLEPLLPPGWSPSRGSIINHGQGLHMFHALYDYLDDMDFYEAFDYQVYDVSDFIAVGWLRPFHTLETLVNASSLPNLSPVVPTPVRTIIDR